MTDQLIFGTVVSVILLAVSAGYWRGWRRLHGVLPGLASRSRLVAFCLFVIATFLALVLPMHGWSRYFLLARAFEKVLLVMVAAPLFWLSVPFHTMAWGRPALRRKRLTRFWFRRNRWTEPLRTITQPGLAWFLFLASFLMWHDNGLVSATMPSDAWRTVVALWLFGSGLLFWGQVIGTAPRRLATRSALARLGCLISVEIPNVATGMYVAFHQYPIYDYYQQIRASNPDYFLHSISLIDDQGFSGALNWVFGSFVYFGSFVFVLGSLWRNVSNSDQPQPLIDWDSDEKFIMPGLEGRVHKPRS